MRIDGYEIEVSSLLERWGMKDHHAVGEELNSRCPWKRHKSGAYKFYINVITGLWNCQACVDKHGNIKQLIQIFEDIEWWDIPDWLRANGREASLDDFDEHIIDILYGENVPIRVRSVKLLRKETTRALKRSSMNLNSYGFWRRSRRFTRATIKFWNLRVDTSSKSRPYIIPITVDGLPFFHVRRSRDEDVVTPKYLFQKGFPRREVLFGIDRAHEYADTLIVCEGMLDCIMVWQALQRSNLLDEYFPVAVFGTSISKEQMRAISSGADDVVLFFDNDKPGRDAVESFLREKKDFGVSIVDYEEIEEGDPGDLTEKQIVRAIQHSIGSLQYRVAKELE